MEERGTLRLDCWAGPDGLLYGQVAFSPEDGGDAFPLGEPVLIGDGSWLEIAPTSVICDVGTEVTSGGPGTTEARKGPEPQAPKPAAPTPEHPPSTSPRPAPRPRGPTRPR